MALVACKRFTVTVSAEEVAGSQRLFLPVVTLLAYEMPTSLLDLPNEIFIMICSLLALDLDDPPHLIDFAWWDYSIEEKEGQQALLSLCLASSRLRTTAQPLLNCKVQPPHTFAVHGSRYMSRLYSAKLRSCRSLVLPLYSGSEFVLLQGLFSLQRLHLLFDPHLSSVSAAQIHHELRTRPSITHLSLTFYGRWRRDSYVSSLLRMITHLHHLRDLYIDGPPVEYLISDHRYDPVAKTPLKLDRLRIYNDPDDYIDDDLEQELMQFAECLLNEDEMHFDVSPSSATCIWIRQNAKTRISSH